MKNHLLKTITVLVSTVILLSGCVSTTLITTNYDSQDGANLYLDGMKVGQTPYRMSDTKIVGTSTAVTLKREDCETINTNIVRAEQPDVGAIIGGLFVWVPFLWTMGYSPVHNYEMEPLEVTTSEESVDSSYKQLKELKGLLDEGIITEAEFKTEKEKILSK